jgi:hypothetical protein
MIIYIYICVYLIIGYQRNLPLWGMFSDHPFMEIVGMCCDWVCHINTTLTAYACHTVAAAGRAADWASGPTAWLHGEPWADRWKDGPTKCNLGPKIRDLPKFLAIPLENYEGYQGYIQGQPKAVVRPKLTACPLIPREDVVPAGSQAWKRRLGWWHMMAPLEPLEILFFPWKVRKRFFDQASWIFNVLNMYDMYGDNPVIPIPIIPLII